MTTTRSSNNRPQHIRQAVQEGIARWQTIRPDGDTAVSPANNTQHANDPATYGDTQTLPGSNGQTDPFFAPLPRRRPLTVQAVNTISPRTMRLSSPFKDSFFLAFRRLFIWLYGIAYFFGGNLWDKIRRRDTLERRAVRLRHTFARIGGTFIKFGQQAAVRADLLPYAYCEELTKLLDKVEPFPTEEAIAAIERVTRKPLRETFQQFDPEPIGSASIACVYQAILHNGDKVAVKVRRPGIGEQFVADFRVLGWLFGVMEFLTIVRPGFTSNVLQEVRSTLMEELDFYKEARFQEIFRNRAQEAKRPYFSAPHVYSELSGEDVIVEEFVSGIWLSELLSAVEQNDAAALAHIRSLNIDPKEVARRLLWAGYWGLWECVFFHADPHPANIIVQRDNHLVFIDFGSMGSLTTSRRMTLHEVFSLEEKEDLENMAKLTLILLEPLPPIDIDDVLRAIEEVFWDALIASRSAHSEWWERTSSQLWLGFFRVTSRFQIPMSFDTVRMIRATLLYDTLAARLDNNIDIGAEYRKYVQDAGEEARERLTSGLTERLENGLTGRDYLRLEKMLNMGDRILYQTNRLLNLRSFNFAALVGKFVASVILALSLFFQLMVITAVIVIGTAIIQQVFYNTELTLMQTLAELLANRWYQIFMIILITISLRRIMFRLRDKEV